MRQTREPAPMVPDRAAEHRPLFLPGWDVPRDELIAENRRLGAENARLTLALESAAGRLARIADFPDPAAVVECRELLAAAGFGAAIGADEIKVEMEG